VRVVGEEREVRDAVARAASREDLAVGQGCEYGEAACVQSSESQREANKERAGEERRRARRTCRAARDRDLLLVDLALLDEVLNASDRVVDVDDAPLPGEALAELLAVPCARKRRRVSAGLSMRERARERERDAPLLPP